MTAQPPGFHPSALRVAAHGQQVASLRESYSSAEVQSAYPRAPADRTRGTNDQLHINQHILKEAKKRQKNVSIAWINFKKTMVQQIAW